MILPFRPAAAGPTDAITVAEVIGHFIAYIRRRWAPSTWAARRGFLERFADQLGHLRIDELRRSTLETWILDQPSYANDWTRHQAAATIRRAFGWACADQLIDAHPFAGVHQPKGLPRRPIDPAQFRALLRAAPPEMRRVLLFLRWTGCRPGELAALRWQHVAPDWQTAELPEHKTRHTQRRPMPRTIHLPPPAQRLLAWIARHPAGSAATAPIFSGRGGRPISRNALGKRLRELRRRVGLPDSVTLYGLRHAYGTHAVLAGVDLGTLAALMGHTRTTTTEHYLHLAGQRAHLAAAARQASIFD